MILFLIFSDKKDKKVLCSICKTSSTKKSKTSFGKITVAHFRHCPLF